MPKDFKRKILIVDKDFQIRFVRKFTIIAILGVAISASMIYLFFYFTYKSGGKDLTKFFVEIGTSERISYSARDKNGKTPLHLVDNYEIAMLLISKGADVYAKDEDKRMPIHDAALKGNLKLVRLFMDNGVDYKKEDKQGENSKDLFLEKYKATEIHWWTGTNFIVETNFILKKYPKGINIQDNLGQTPLHLAAKFNYIQMIQFLLYKKASVDILDKNKKSPVDIFKEEYKSTKLHFWVTAGKLNEAEKILKANKTLINKKDIKGDTPLHIATRLRDIKMAAFLIANGARIEITNKGGKSPESEAQKTRNKALLKIFYQ